MDDRCQFSPGIACAPDNEREPFLSLRRVGGVMGGFNGIDEVIAQLQGVGWGVKRERMLAQAREVWHSRAAAQGYHKNIVWKRALRCSYLLLVEINLLNLSVPDKELSALLEIADGDDHVIGVRTPVRYCPQQWRKQ